MTHEPLVAASCIANAGDLIKHLFEPPPDVMKPFHVSIHVRPAEAASGKPATVGDAQVRSLDISGPAGHAPFPVSFEQTQLHLEGQDRMYVEPDGSFVRTGVDGEAPWQIEGTMHDREGRMISLEVWGSCPTRAFDELLGSCAWPATELMFFLVREGVWLDESEFRRLAAMN